MNWNRGRTVGVTIGILAAMSALTGCPEDLSSDDLTVTNESREDLTFDFVYYDESLDQRGSNSLAAGRSLLVFPAYDGEHCIQADLVAERDGVEVDRGEGPICVPEDGLTIRVGSEDDDGG